MKVRLNKWAAVPAVVASLVVTSGAQVAEQTATWTQWGGPARNFVVPAAALAESWPESGPPVLWSRPLGLGHSAIVTDGERLFTMYRVGNARAKLGPWDAAEVVVALDARTGTTLWEHRYPSGHEDFSFGAGPHSTPLVVAGRVFTVGTNQQLFAFDAATGRVLWSHDLIKDFGSPELLIRPVVKTGYGCSPLAFRDTIICSVGGAGQSVMAFRQSDGGVAWKSGDFLTSAAAPILIELGGRPQAVFLAGGAVLGLDPATGAVLWAHPHDPGNDLNCGTPLWGAGNILFMSSAYQAGSRALRLTERDGVTDVEELWFSNRTRFMFLSSMRDGDFVYGTSGDFGPAFLTALDVRTGAAAWQARGFARASLIRAGDKTILLDEDGDLALARLTPAGATILAQARVFDTTSWTVPTLVGTTLYARDRERIVALALGSSTSGGARVAPGSAPAAPASAGRSGSGTSVWPRQPAPRVRLAGSWKLDAAGSQVAGGNGLPGVIAAGASPMLFITQAENGAMVVEGPVNTGHARYYRSGQSTTTSLAGGTIAMTSAWSDDAFVSEGAITPTAGGPVPVRERYRTSADGSILTVEVVRGGAADAVSTLRYTRLQSAGPCQTWPTPCKR